MDINEFLPYAAGAGAGVIGLAAYVVHRIRRARYDEETQKEINDLLSKPPAEGHGLGYDMGPPVGYVSGHNSLGPPSDRNQLSSGGRPSIGTSDRPQLGKGSNRQLGPGKK